MFLEGQFTLLKEGKRLADEIVRLESERDEGGKIDALVTSTGFLTFNGAREGMFHLFSCTNHKLKTKTLPSLTPPTTKASLASANTQPDTSEGLDADTALIYYNRLLLTTLLLPLLSRAPSPRVVTVFSAGNEAPFTPEQVSSEFRNGFTRLGWWSIFPSPNLFESPFQPDAGSTLALAALTTLSFEQLAAKYPNVAFIHSYPGGVQTEILNKLMDTAKGIWSYPAWFVKKFVNPVFWLISKPFTVPVEGSGERHLFLATSAAYPAASIASGQVEGSHGGVVPLVEGVERKKGSAEHEGRSNGVYRTQSTCEVAGANAFLTKARKEGLDVLGWRETVKVFERILGEGVARGV